MRSRLCPQERQANPSTPDLSLADDPWLPQKDLGAFELALSSALPGRSLFDPPLSPFVDYQDRARSATSRLDEANAVNARFLKIRT